MEIKYPEVGICGLSCRLCPSYHADGASKCGGCKSESRMSAGCPFITCAIRKKGVEFCLQCEESDTCEKWRAHRKFSEQYDTFVCYQKLEDNIASIKRKGVDWFEESQQSRERLLDDMLGNFNEGRSKSYYCISATIFEIRDLKAALAQARRGSDKLTIKERSRRLHTILDDFAEDKQYYLRLRKPPGKTAQPTVRRQLRKIVSPEKRSNLE
jgi:uncharacterized protein DUF3795